MQLHQLALMVIGSNGKRNLNINGQNYFKIGINHDGYMKLCKELIMLSKYISLRIMGWE